MINNKAFCMDCMELMKTTPDKYFDLAVVDAPYGDAMTDANSQSVNVERERERESSSQSATRTREEHPTVGRNVGICEVAASGRDSVRGSTDTNTRRQPLRFHSGDRWNRYFNCQQIPAGGGGYR